MWKSSWVRRSVAALVLWAVVLDSVGHAWCPIAHYLIGRAAAKNKGIYDKKHPLEHYCNLPDYEPSKQFWITRRDDGGMHLTPEFCWSHGVLNTGTIDVGSIAVSPLKPAYADDGRYPGEDMRRLITRTLHLPHVAEGSEEHWDLMNTVNGFRAHNAADRVVHFEFFLGATAAMTPDLRREAWTVHHGLKEVYAEYLLLATLAYGKNKELKYKQRYEIHIEVRPDRMGVHRETLRANSQEEVDEIIASYSSAPNFRYTVTCESVLDMSPGVFSLWGDTGVENLGFKGNAALMHQAQLVFRKNRRNIMRWGEEKGLQVQSVEKIKRELDPKTGAEARGVVGLFRSYPWATWRVGPLKLTDMEYIDSKGISVKMVNETPPGHEAEYMQLIEVGNFLDQRFLNSMSQYPSWTVWAPESIISKYLQAVELATQWIYSRSELRLRHH